MTKKQFRSRSFHKTIHVTTRRSRSRHSIAKSKLTTSNKSSLNKMLSSRSSKTVQNLVDNRDFFHSKYDDKAVVYDHH